MRMLPCCFAVAAALTAVPALATNYTVNSEADVPEVSPGNGTCDPEFAIEGVCTLRAAIQEANANAGSDTIFLTADQTYTLTRTGQDQTASNGDLDITDDVIIIFFASGTRPIVDANGQERAFEIHSGNVTLLGFDITGGDATIDSDQAGGGVAVNFDAGNVQLSLLRFYGNLANFGGGLYNDGPNTTLSSSELYENEAENDFPESSGSAIYNRGVLDVDHSSVFANSGTGDFGAIAIENTPPFTGSPILNVINTTVASNIGFGINSQDESTLVVRNSTIVANTAVGIRIGGTDGFFQMRNSAVVRNLDLDCQISIVADLNLDRYNMDSDDTCELSDGTSNYPGVEQPYLTPLAMYDGFTHVSRPLTRSPLIDTGHPVIGAIGCEEDDQQFVERPIDFDGDGNARCDVGAVELSDDVIFFDAFETL